MKSTYSSRERTPLFSRLTTDSYWCIVLLRDGGEPLSDTLKAKGLANNYDGVGTRPER
ncbi:hypothetical protein OAO16_00885 [Opitutales bacterium]|nr:hypothetical protein [Opitutales bacterium]